MSTLAKRFWEKVERRGTHECWLWTASTNEHGYGLIHPDGKRGTALKAHRVVMELAGYDTSGRVVLHTCDNPPCVNPAHLRIGTQAENVADMHDKGRGNIGSVNGGAKLTEAQVAQIRRQHERGARGIDLADKYHVSKMTISRIVTGQGWRHVA